MPVNSFDDYPMSWRPVLQRTGPLSLELAAQLEADIKSGALLPGTRLPPQRELADFLDVNLSTVSRAFRLCTQKGLLSATVGSGTFVAYDALASLSLLPHPDKPSLIELGSLLPDDASYREVAQMLREVASESDVERLFGYGSMTATLWQREAAAKYIQKAGYSTTADHLLTSNGSQNALAAILAGLFSPGDCIGTDPLTYPGIKSAARMLGVRLVPLRQEDGQLSPDGLDFACRHEHIKGLYLMPDFQNPTAQTMGVDLRRAVARTAQKHSLLIIEDSIHTLLRPTPLPAIASFAPEHTVYIASLSKTISPGLRLSYLAAPGHCRDALAEALYNINLTVSPFLLELASRIMASDKAEALLETHRARARQRGALADSLLDGFCLQGPAESLFRWLVLPEGWSAEGFEQAALRDGVQVYGAHRFAVGIKPPAAARLAIASPPDMEQLRTGLLRLRALLEQGPQK